jgi:Holliday junction resolvase RusA-like endonuclease
VTAVEVEQLVVSVLGRPAPQGSKNIGEHGQMREASVYLAPWRAAVKRACYERFKALGIAPAALPLYRGPVAVRIAFYLDTGDRIDGPPDIDKLMRSTFDALTQARVWEDDARVVAAETFKYAAGTALEWSAKPGASISVRSA